jgi:hypothetical protein
LVFCAALPCLAAAQSLTRADHPQLQIGDWWRYETTVLPSQDKRSELITITDIRPDAIVTTAREVSVYDRAWGLKELRVNGETTFRADPPRSLLAFPLEVGRQWNGDAVHNFYARGFVRRWQGTVFVDGVERVTVPAGTFMAFVVQYDGYYPTSRGNATTRHTETIWYVPEVGRWVKRDMTWSVTQPSFGRRTERSIVQLTDYKRGNDEPGARTSAVSQ